MTREKYYRPGITGAWRYEPPPGRRAPRTEAVINFCIAHRVEVACALWAVIGAAWATAIWLWFG